MIGGMKKAQWGILLVAALLVLLAWTFSGQSLFKTAQMPSHSLTAAVTVPACTGGRLVYGWAWSSNIGWINFGSNNASRSYGVCYDDVAKTFSGYAWSSNIGWLKLDGVAVGSTGDLMNSAQFCTPLTNASSCSGTPQAGGWDGKLAMSGTWTGGSKLDTSLPTLYKLTGFAWGSDVVGWVKLNGVWNDPSGCTGVCVVIPAVTTGTLVVTKNVSGGSKVASDFMLHVKNGGSDVATSPQAGSTVGTTYSNLIAGTYIVSEDPMTDYTADYTSCGSGGTVIVMAGGITSCLVKNNYTPVVTTATLNVKKVVVNTGGGTKSESDFIINVSGSSASPNSFIGSSAGVNVTLGAGNYSVSEPATPGYTATYSSDCSGSISSGQTKNCTVTNTYNTAASASVTVTIDVSHNVTSARAPINNVSHNSSAVPIWLTINNSNITPITGVEVRLPNALSPDSIAFTTLTGQTYDCSDAPTTHCYDQTLGVRGVLTDSAGNIICTNMTYANSDCTGLTLNSGNNNFKLYLQFPDRGLANAYYTYKSPYSTPGTVNKAMKLYVIYNNGHDTAVPSPLPLYNYLDSSFTQQ